jgi:uncharacterized protein YwgA
MSLGKNIFTITKSSMAKYEKTKNKLMVDDLILLLLYVGKIRGTTRLQKQVFLTWKQVFPKITTDPMFFPWKYGAYSRVVEDSMKILEMDLDIIVKKGRGEGTIYQISKKGTRKIQKKIKQINIDLGVLRKKKTDWDDWGPKGTLRYVYRNYPEYATQTRVPSLKWE